MALPDETKLYMCHDYPAEGQKAQMVITVAEQKAKNSMIHSVIDESSYVQARNAKDTNKDVPALLLPSIQVNLRAGYLGEPEDNGKTYLKIPLNQL